MLTSYRRLLGHPGVVRVLVVALIVKLGTPVLSLALLLAAVDRLDSYEPAGLVLTGHALALAVCAPFGGRLADRYGSRSCLTGYLVAHALGYILLLWALRSVGHVPGGFLIGAAVLLGATTPPVGAVIRGAWPRLVPAASLPAAYALDNAVNEMMFIVGPVLVPVLMLVLPAQGVVAAAGGAVLLGTVLLLGTEPVRHERPSPPDPVSLVSRLAGPLIHRAVLVWLVLAGLGTFAFGCLRIATVAAAAVFGSPASAGVLMGLLSAGALAGSIGYGARVRRLDGRRLLVVLSLAEAAVLLVCVLAPNLVFLALLIILAGLVTGPRDAVLPGRLAAHAPVRYRTETFAWLNTFMWTGYGLGTAVAGSLTGPDGDGDAAFTAAVLVAGSAAALAAVTRFPGDLAGAKRET